MSVKQDTSRDIEPDRIQDKDSMEALLYTVGQDKNRDAFITLFNHFAPRIKSYLMKSGASPDQADEIAQDTMLIVWKKAPLYDPTKANASTWIFTIARNKRIDVMRKQKRAELDPNDPLLINDELTSPAQNIDLTKEAEIMAKAIQSLPEEQGTILRKSYFEDMTHDAISQETGLALGTVKSRIRLALEKLRNNQEVQKIWR